MTQLAVRDVARELHVSHGRVGELIRNGSLGATRIGSQYVVADGELARFIAFNRQAHVRSFSRDIAWAAADLADGGSARTISNSERSRLRSRMDRSDADLSKWVRRLHSLSDESYRTTIAADGLARLLADERVTRSGSFATNLASDRLVSNEGTIWLANSKVLAELRRDYGLLRSSKGAIRVRISDANGSHVMKGARNAFRLVVVADLVAEGDTRSRSSAEALLQQVIQDRSWRAS